MERGAFKLLNQMERSWWYRGRIAAVRAALFRSDILQATEVLDYGAGFGGMSGTLSTFSNSIDAYEPDGEARVALAARGYRHVFVSDTEALAHHYDLIGLFDVVEHIEHDGAFLKAAHDALKEGGVLAITVPAFPFLWSAHDVSHRHFRRYTKASMRALLESFGYKVEYISYWNMLLFLPAAVMRLFGRTGESALGLPRWIDTLFFAVVKLESLVMRHMPLPFGTGLVVVARKR